ncbi:MAG: SMC-Scp complex subunit ScpB [Elusimicrobia bacterium]|nr:SMC-Scp complex subunit ScpB [Elusimicrobiota bacterium]MBI2915360.1 SMC-Scp complex subunit ScpB [Elusimicrobiota bacterium]MBI3012188.1 SMC-Scp complex subunit ScpB [Elusimicrobiota bacterium]MBI4217899.1 SMC-Scp complex subunit ScpB [Elusimicrobiota bacterium]
MDKSKLKEVLEVLLFVTNRPLPILELCDIVGDTQASIQETIAEIKQDMEIRKSGLQVVEVAEGVQFASKTGYAYWVKKLFREQTLFRLSQSALETLSIVAYKQPITRAEIEEIRGVEVIGVLETLIERKLVKVTGRKETIGRPLLYGTSQDFLRHFNLWKISDLPSLEDMVKDLEKKNETAPESGAVPNAQTE